MQEDYNRILESHDQDVVRILESQQTQQNQQKIALEVIMIEYKEWRFLMFQMQRFYSCGYIIK